MSANDGRLYEAQTASEGAPRISGEASLYDDLVIERYNYEFETNASNLSNNFQLSTQQLLDEQLAGGLRSNEVAELVALEVPFVNLRQRESEGDATSGNSVRWDFNIQLLEQGLFPFNGVEVSSFDTDPDGDGNDEFVPGTSNLRKNTSADRVLFDWSTELSGQVIDAANGPGAGGISTVTQPHYMVNYRGTFGRGPIVEDDWVVGANGNVTGNTPVSVAGKAHFKMYWDVMEFEQQRSLRDIFVSNEGTR